MRKCEKCNGNGYVIRTSLDTPHIGRQTIVECKHCNGAGNIKQTNADKVRSMSDEELADWLDSMLNEDRLDWKPIGCYNCIYSGTHHSVEGSSQYMCKDCCYEDGLLAWLQSKEK